MVRLGQINTHINPKTYEVPKRQNAQFPAHDKTETKELLDTEMSLLADFKSDSKHVGCLLGVWGSLYLLGSLVCPLRRESDLSFPNLETHPKLQAPALSTLLWQIMIFWHVGKLRKLSPMTGDDALS